MNKRAILVGISISVVFFLATAGAGAALLQTNVGSSMAEMNENGPMDPEKGDVPTWEIGSSWTYHHELDLEEEDGDMYVHIVEEMTYTVEAIEQHEQDGDVFYAYNLSLEGEVIDGDGEVEGYNVDVDGGEIVGYKICRVSDLAIVVDRQEREIDAVGGGFIGIDLWLDLNRIYQPPIENYDFPVSVDDLFWSNTTMIAEGRYEYDAGMIGSGEDTFEEVIDYRGESTIPYMENITVPAGDFETYYIHETVSGIEGDEDSGEMEIWYDPEVKSYVKQIEDIGVDDFELTMSQELIDHEVFETSNELSIDPSEQWIKDEVTITGQFPDYPDENVTIWIPEGAEPRDGWNTTTDGDGYFEKVIQVPVAEDMTETTLDFSSIGFVAELDEQEDELVVSTLVIYHDNSPVYSTPTDGAVISSLDPELRVLLGHDKGEDMNVTFYDASDHSEIGFQENVSSGNYSNITWEGLDRGTTYGWYAVADDDDEAYESEVWEFTTEGPNFQLSIVSPEDGENFVEGDLVTLDYEVENIGTEDNTQNISFEVFHEEDLVFEYNETVSLMAGDLYEGEFTWEADMLGEFTFKIVSEDDEEEVDLTILEEFDLTVNIQGEGTVEVDGDVVEDGWSDEYADGTEVTLEAFAEEDWNFVGWTGDHEGTEEEVTVVIDADKEVTALFELKTYELTVNIEGEGSVEKEPDQEEYEHGTEVIVTATPEEGWLFVGWTGDVPEGEEENEEIMVIMNEDKELTANFEIKEYTLTVLVEGEGSVEVDPEQEQYEHGTEVALTVGPEEGWLFVEWIGDAEGTEENITVVMDENKDLTAHFIQEFELTVNIEGEGDVLVDPDEEVYLDGTEVTITAIPDEGYEFVEWTGDYEGTEDEITIEMDDDKEITAVFEEAVYYTLTVEVEGEGTVEIDPDDEVYEEGTEVNLTAIPDQGYEFMEWTGDYEGTEEEITIVVEADMHITAIFEEDVVVDTYTLTVDIEGEGEVAVDPEQDEYEEGTVVELTASPEEGWEFVEWTGDETGTDTIIEITMDSDMSITAHFEELEEVYFEVSIVSPGDGDEFEEGDEIVVEYEVMNTGVVTGEQDIELYVGGELVDTEEGVEIEPDGTYEGQFTFEVEEDGTIELEVRGSDEGEVDTISLTISAMEDPDDPDDEDDDFPWWLIVVVLIIIAVIVVVLLVLMKKEDKGDVLDEENYDEVYEEGYEEEYGQEPEDEVFTEEDEEF